MQSDHLCFAYIAYSLRDFVSILTYRLCSTTMHCTGLTDENSVSNENKSRNEYEDKRSACGGMEGYGRTMRIFKHTAYNKHITAHTVHTDNEAKRRNLTPDS